MMSFRKSILLLFVCLSAAKAFDTTDLDVEAEDGEERTVFTSNGNYYIALNTTYLLLYATLFGIGLLAALAISALFGAASSDDSGYGYGQQSSGYGGSAGGEDPHAHGHFRNKRNIEGNKKMSQCAAAIVLDPRLIINCAGDRP